MQTEPQLDTSAAVELRYRTLFDLVPVAVYATDSKGVIQEFNRRAAELWGRNPRKNAERFCGSFKIFYPDGKMMPHEQCPMARVLRGEKLDPTDLEIIVEQENGERRDVIVAPRALMNEDGAIVGAINCLYDITGRKEIEAALRESEGRFRTVADNVPQLIWTNNAKGEADYFNDRWYEYSGLSYDESAGQGWEAIVHPEDAPASVKRWREAFRKGKVFDTEYRLRRKDGEYRWFIGRNVPLRNSQGRVISWFGTATDIHDFKTAEAALRESEERFRQFAENSIDVFWIMDAKTRRVEYLNPAHEKIWGEARQLMQADSNRWKKLVHPDDRERVKDNLPNLLSGRSQTIEYRITRPVDKAVRWIRDTGFAIRDENGQITRVAGVAQDITEDKQRTEALGVTEERFQLLVEGAKEYAMFLLDPSNEITYWSKGAERVFGWTAEEAVGQSGELVFTPEDRTREQEEKEVAIAMRDGTASDRRWHLRKDGTRIWVDGVMRRLDDEQTGALRGFAKIARDATEQRRAEEELRRAHEELELRVKDRTRELQAKNRLLQLEAERRQMLESELLRITERERARIGQDLHDSLCQELTATAFLLKSRAKAIASQSRAASDSLIEAAETVNKNAGLARDLARGLHPFELGSAGLASALRELCSRTNESLSCRCDCPRSLRLDQNVSLNLYRIAQEAVTNSVKHANANEIVISLERTHGEIVLSVSDDGEGKRRRGHGLGTHIMEYRARAAGGTLQVESGRARGTMVTCRVPAK